MTIKEARSIYYINLEIKRIKKDIAELEESRQYYKPINLDGMPRGSPGEFNVSEEYLEKRYKLERLLDLKLRQLQQKLIEFENFLATVDDPEIRLILRLRCVNNLTWEEIGEETKYDRTTVAKKFRAYFNIPTNPIQGDVK